MPVWPGSLDDFMLGAKETLQHGVIRTDMDAGPVKVRRRFTAVSRFISCEIMLRTVAQRSAFDTFFNTTLAGGSLSFEHDDPKDGTTADYRFAGPPEYTYTKAGTGSGALNTKVKLSLEILP